MRKKYHVIFSAAFFFLLCLMACGQGTKPANDPAEDSVKEQGQIVEGGGKSGEIGKIQEENKIQSPWGKAFGSLPVVGTEDSIYCNLARESAYKDADGAKANFFCRDPLYGILYYVDYGGDYRIHAIRDGKSELVVNLPGRDLFCRGGKLYFLMDSFGKFSIEGISDGNVLSYDPVSGTVELVLDQEFDNIVVFQDLICCIKEQITGVGGSWERWFYFFETGKMCKEEVPEPLTYQLETAGRYQEYFLFSMLKELTQEDVDAYEDERTREWLQAALTKGEKLHVTAGYQLRRWDGSGEIALDGLQVSPSFRIDGENILWTRNQELYQEIYSYHIPTGKNELIANLPFRWKSENEPGKDAMEDAGEGTSEDMRYYLSWDINVNNQFYASNYNYIFHFDSESGKLRKFRLLMPGGVPGIMDRFYTDGKELYGLLQYVDSSEQKMISIKEATYEEAMAWLEDVGDAWEDSERENFQKEEFFVKFELMNSEE